MLALRRILGDPVETPGLARAAELLAKASTSAPTAGRVVYAGDGHVAALVSERIGGTEAHVLCPACASGASSMRPAASVDGRATKDRVEAECDRLAALLSVNSSTMVVQAARLE